MLIIDAWVLLQGIYPILFPYTFYKALKYLKHLWREQGYNKWSMCPLCDSSP